MEIGRSLRGARAAVFAAACVGVSAAGHVWMSGAALPVWALLVAVLAVGGGGYAVAGRQRGFAAIAALMLTGELGLHLLFSHAQHAPRAAASAASSMPWMPDLSRISMAHPLPVSAWLCGHGMAGAAASSGRGAMASMAWLSAHGSAGMIGVHAAAGLLGAWWLRQGESAAFQLLRALALSAFPLLVLGRPVAPAVPDLTDAVPAADDVRVPPARSSFGYSVIRRGPPRLPAFSM